MSLRDIPHDYPIAFWIIFIIIILLITLIVLIGLTGIMNYIQNLAPK